MQNLIGYLRLTRPANIITAVADILAGIAISGYFTSNPLRGQEIVPVVWLIVATIGLYGGGVVFNDVFDAELDMVERPERPIPSGLIAKQSAAILAAALLLVGIIAAFLVHNSFKPSGFIAVLVAIAALVYDKWGKHNSLLGPVNMGTCRGLNLLLGISIVPEAIDSFWYLSLVPVLYIAAITMISRGEVHGGKKGILYIAAVFYAIVIATIVFISANNKTLLHAVFFLLLFAYMIFTPLLKAIPDPRGPLIGKAVKAGVIALILMNVAWAAAFGNLYLAIIILLLLPISIRLSKAFAVT